jgi:hypothetical protein
MSREDEMRQIVGAALLPMIGCGKSETGFELEALPVQGMATLGGKTAAGPDVTLTIRGSARGLDRRGRQDVAAELRCCGDGFRDGLGAVGEMVGRGRRPWAMSPGPPFDSAQKERAAIRRRTAAVGQRQQSGRQGRDRRSSLAAIGAAPSHARKPTPQARSGDRTCGMMTRPKRSVRNSDWAPPRAPFS